MTGMMADGVSRPRQDSAGDDSRVRLTFEQQSDGWWLWFRQEGREAVNLGWSGDDRAICGALASRLSRRLIDVVAQALRAEGLDVQVRERSG